ncbi:hypothetical protein ACFV9P_27950 [Streptomyces sp. NPDC059892]|uniref:hypothetical protein n=1 Tax=Streptomyces sp. NPDC059892 TaxID=3346989 RepID=UPI003665DBF1
MTTVREAADSPQVEVLDRASVSLAVTRALAEVRAAQTTAPAPVAQFLDIVAEQIVETGDPVAVYDQVLDLISGVILRDLLIRHTVRMVIPDGTSGAMVTEALLFPAVEDDGPRLLIVPRGQRPAATLNQARAVLGVACP